METCSTEQVRGLLLYRSVDFLCKSGSHRNLSIIHKSPAPIQSNLIFPVDRARQGPTPILHPSKHPIAKKKFSERCNLHVNWSVGHDVQCLATGSEGSSTRSFGGICLFHLSFRIRIQTYRTTTDEKI